MNINENGILPGKLPKLFKFVGLDNQHRANFT